MKPSALRIYDSPAALAPAAAELIVRLTQGAVRARGRCLIVLAGGGTPEATYARLAQPAHLAPMSWLQTYLFFGDERCVPHDDLRSNYSLVKRTLLDGVTLPAGHVLPIPTDGQVAAGAAAAYSSALAAFFDAASGGPPPRFDIVLLGLGQDGHTASLLPGAAALHEQRQWVTWSPPGTLPPLVDRITLTYPVLNAARHVVFLVAGANKAPALREVLETEPALERLPAAGVRPADGTLTWLVDAAAAALLAERSCQTESIRH